MKYNRRKILHFFIVLILLILLIINEILLSLRVYIIKNVVPDCVGGGNLVTFLANQRANMMYVLSTVKLRILQKGNLKSK